MSLLEPSRETLKLIQAEINESGDNKLETNVAYIKGWLDCQPHLPGNYDERLIYRFLRGCKHDVERTKRKLDMYFSVRSVMPELFSQRDPSAEEIRRSMQVMRVTPMPKLTSQGLRVSLFKLMPHELSQFNISLIFKHILMVSDIRVLEEPPIAGDVWIFDVAPSTASHVPKLAVPLLRKILICAQEAYPQRLKEIHIVNAPIIIDKVLNLFKNFMKEKMRNRFYVHSTLADLHKSVPLDSLPSDYGGNDLSTSALSDQWVKKLESFKPWFEEQDNIKSDESKRVDKPVKTNEEMFGFEGTFRTLTID